MNPEALNGIELGMCTIQHMIGRGGLGVVFQAQQAHSQRSVALKVLLPSATLSSEQRTLFLQRFRRDMPVVASLRHTNILPVEEYGERDGVVYLVMSHYTGGTLQDVLANAGPLAWSDLMYYLDQMAAAIDYAQERGVLHRNIKPANVLLATDGSLVVTDFGLVDIVTEGLAPQELLLGASGPRVTPDYIAPEQVMGEAVDGRADLYSLGVILYQMVTGKMPFPGTTAVYIAAQHVQLLPPSPRALRTDLPPAAEEVILQAMAKKASHRYARAQDIAGAFRSALMTANIALQAGQKQSMTGAAEVKTPPIEDASQPSTGAIPLWSKRLRSEMHSTMTAGKRAMPEQFSPTVTTSTAHMLNTTRVLPEMQQLATSEAGTPSAISSTRSNFPRSLKLELRMHCALLESRAVLVRR